MTCHFISDLHLSPHTPLLVEGFNRFIKQIPKTDTLYILGDFFDAWIGDDEDTTTFLDIQQTLKQSTASGLRIYFMRGNRDFAVGSTFEANTGVTMLSEPSLITIGETRFLLMHGDSLCTQDKSYMRFRSIIRNPILLSVLLALPLSWRRKIATGLRGKSKQANSGKKMEIMDVNESEVQKILSTYSVDILLHGHTHRPARHQYENQERIVLGDWGLTGWSLSVDDHSIELKEFPI